MNRRTSPYHFQINVPRGGDTGTVLDALVLSLPPGVALSDRHSIRDEGASYVSVTFRAADDGAATQIADRTLARFREEHPDAGVHLTDWNEMVQHGSAEPLDVAVLLTGYGMHRRVVTAYAETCGDGTNEETILPEAQGDGSTR